MYRFAEPDPAAYRTFNEFFYRKPKPSARPIAPRPEMAVLPADGRHLGFPDAGAVKGDASLQYAEAVSLGYQGITVNNIPPGFVDTPMLRASPVDVDKESNNSPMKRAGKPEDIAAACSYLVSEAASYVTGHTLSVNGGKLTTTLTIDEVRKLG